MKNRIIRATLCCFLCAAMLGSTTQYVSAAPVAGAMAAMTSTATGTGTTAEAVGTEAAEPETKATQTSVSTKTGAATAGAGVTLAMTDIINGSTTPAEDSAAAQPATEEEAAPAEDTAAVSENPTETVAAEYQDVAIAQVDNYVNVRTEPNEESEVVGKLYNNCAATVTGTNEDGSWYQITSGSVNGYIKAEFLSVGNEELIKSVCRRVATVTTETLYVRALPSQDSPVIGMVPQEEDLTVTDETYLDSWGWVGVSIEEGEGYVSTEFVTLSTEYTYAESKEEEEARLAKEAAEREAAAAAAAAAQAQASAKSAAAAASTNTGASEAAAPSSSGGSAVASYATQFIGNPYVFGGSSLTNGTDCSGFVMSVYAAFGVSLPHSSSAMRSCGYEVSADAMQPGDIVCYSGHVGIYIGNGTIVHASTPADGIKTSSVGYRSILAVRRIF